MTRSSRGWAWHVLAGLPMEARRFLILQLALLPACWALPFLRDPHGSGGIVVFLCSGLFATLSNGVAAIAAWQLAEERGWRAGRAARTLAPLVVLAVQLALLVWMAARAESAWAFVALGVAVFPLGTAVAVAAGSARESWRFADLPPLREAA